MAAAQILLDAGVTDSRDYVPYPRCLPWDFTSTTNNIEYRTQPLLPLFIRDHCFDMAPICTDYRYPLVGQDSLSYARFFEFCTSVDEDYDHDLFMNMRYGGKSCNTVNIPAVYRLLLSIGLRPENIRNILSLGSGTGEVEAEIYDYLMPNATALYTDIDPEFDNVRRISAKDALRKYKPFGPKNESLITISYPFVRDAGWYDVPALTENYNVLFFGSLVPGYHTDPMRTFLQQFTVVAKEPISVRFFTNHRDNDIEYAAILNYNPDWNVYSDTSDSD